MTQEAQGEAFPDQTSGKVVSLSSKMNDTRKFVTNWEVFQLHLNFCIKIQRILEMHGYVRYHPENFEVCSRYGSELMQKK